MMMMMNDHDHGGDNGSTVNVAIAFADHQPQPPQQSSAAAAAASSSSSSSKVVIISDISTLPRSIQWRLKLGLLQDPNHDVSATKPLNNNSVQSTPTTLTLDQLVQHNQERLTCQAERFNDLVAKHLEEEQEGEGEQEEEQEDTNDRPASSTTASTTGNHSGGGGGGQIASMTMDPLTAMVMEEEARETRKAELYLKYRKERARRKRGLTTEARIIESERGGEEVVDRASLVIIEKDLKRLPHPADDKQSSFGCSSSPTTQRTDSHERDARITSLREVLYIYAQEHSSMGYRQGMHEIASYLMYLLELEHQEYPDHPLFNPILPICYVLLERVLDQLNTAYDATGGKSLQQMSVTILGKILQNDNPLYHHLTSNPNIPPPPIYCTRWVRLMFSREVVGYENVFKLWDVLFDYQHVMHALESACATRILLLRDALLVPDNNTLDLLMNVPPLLDISQFTSLLERLMIQNETDPSIPIPKSQQVLPRQMANTALSNNTQATGFGLSSPMMQQQQQHLHYQSSTPLRPDLQQLQLNSHNPLETPLRVQGGAPQNVYQSSQSSTTTFSDSSRFSFSKVRQSLRQTSESLGKKILTTTNEWKQAAVERQASADGLPPYDPLSGMWVAGGPTQVTTNNGQFADPLLHQSSPLGTNTNMNHLAAVPSLPKTPTQHLHEGWSNRLEEKIVTIQKFLEDLKSKEVEGTVPDSVWEALVDMDRMKKELRNYSRSMANS